MLLYCTIIRKSGVKESAGTNPSESGIRLANLECWAAIVVIGQSLQESVGRTVEALFPRAPLYHTHPRDT